MGLDSVDLLMAFEKFFGIRIPDATAEKLYTIQDTVDCVAYHLQVNANSKQLQQDVFVKLSACIRSLTSPAHAFGLADKIDDYFVPDNTTWHLLEACIGLQIPRLDTPTPQHKLSPKLNKLINWAPQYSWQQVSFEQLVDVICASNFTTLVNPKAINSQYEIYICIMGITVEKTGVSYYEITPGKSFTNDLGVD